METTGNTTRLYEKLYYETNVDVQINWLKFLNSFKSISKRGYLDLAPILERVGNELKENEEFKLPVFVSSADIYTRKKLKKSLDKNDIPEVKEYVNEGITLESTYDLIVGLFIRKFIRRNKETIESLISYYESSKRTQDWFLKNLLEMLITTKLSTDIQVDNELNPFIDYFASSCQIDLKETTTAKSYVHIILTLMEDIIKEFNLDKKYPPFVIEQIEISKSEISMGRVDDLEVLFTALEGFENIIKYVYENDVSKTIEKPITYSLTPKND